MKTATVLEVKQLREGAELPILEKPPVTREQLVRYANASGDLNPLHTDDEFAKSIGMDGVIAHGMLIMGFLGQYVQQLAGKEAFVANFSMRFAAVTRPGDVITCRGTVARLFEENGKQAAELQLTAEKAPGKPVGSGTAVLLFGRQEDR
ncbi:MaoC/PaaZ C-terminal domain-containing protein [Bhargavaea beijingensis]|uniref:MaoC/PaaZ C-terminal domain-containing protein n=1 Tax=Bhargavaea beijingensis TaxID=426756 RepID=UPI0022258EAF|nr:MaoC/PaaZ C-terminal domain-containing protein [Bhargavaea beijingensis]MCW1928385.1 MaoC/PaaZ C-terminal domain-containing protein [Bhargavaea beijingensis]